VSDIDFQNGYICGMATKGLVKTGDPYEPKVWNDSGEYSYFYIDFKQSLSDFSMGMLTESIIVHDSVQIPCPDPGPAYIPKRVTAETSLARAEAWWQYPNIQLRLVQKDTTIETRLRGAIIERNHYKSLYEKLSIVPEPVKVIPKIYKVSLWLCIGAVVVFAIWLFIKYKVKILSLIK